MQAYSDAELFWVIKNGIRLTGMPGYAKTHPDPEIWNLVRYVRSLGPEKRAYRRLAYSALAGPK